MKERYEKAWLTVTVFETDDVIATSATSEDQTSGTNKTTELPIIWGK